MLEATRRDGSKQAELQQRVRSGRDDIDVEASQRRDPTKLGAGLQQRHGLRDRPRLGRQPTKARQRGIDHRLRRQSRDRPRVRGGARHPILTQCPQQLSDVERGSPRRRTTGLAERQLDLVAEDRARQTVHAAKAQRRRLHALQTLRRAQPLEQRIVGAGLDGPCSQDQRGRQVRDPSRQIHEPAQRRRVTPMDVIGDEQQRPAGRQIGGEPIQPVHDGGRLDRRRIRLCAWINHALGMHGRAGQHALTDRGVGAHHRGFEQLTDDRIGKSHLELAAASRQHHHPPAPRAPHARVQQLRLADTGRALDERERPSTALSGAQRIVDHGELVRPFEQMTPASGHRLTLCAHAPGYEKSRRCIVRHHRLHTRGGGDVGDRPSALR